MTNSDLRQRAASIGALLDQVDDLKEEIKARFEVAKNDGYNASALRKAITIHRMDDKRREKHDSGQSDLFLYLEEIEGTAIREAAQ